MPNTHLKIIGIGLLILVILENSISNSQEDDQDFFVAKRSLVQREHEYFKKKPMSEDLKSFIDRYKRKNSDQENEIQEKRKKRSDAIDENLLYMIKDGELVPINSVKEKKRSNEVKKVESQAYTVVPLVIPVNLKSPEVKLIKTRTLDEEMQNSEVKGGESSVSTTIASDKGSNKAAGGDEEAPPSVENGENDDNKTQEETQVLHKILEDVEGLMQSKHEGNRKEGVLCNLNGSWISDAAGMRFDICYKNSTRKKFRIHVADRIPPNEDGFLCDGNWTVFGEIPFLHSGMVIALAVHAKDKHIATFIGECRVCEGSETVTGTWMIGRSSRDCKDQKAAHKILADVWRREQGHTLRKKHLQEIGYQVKDEDED